MRTCTKCKIEKELSEFNKDNSRKDGLRPDCKSCRSQRKKTKLTLDEIKQIHKKYYEKNKNKITQYREQNKDKLKEYRNNRKEQKRIYDKEYKIKNKERIYKAGKEYYEKNKEVLNNKSKEYYSNNKERLIQLQKEYRIKKKELSKNSIEPIDEYLYRENARLGID